MPSTRSHGEDTVCPHCQASMLDHQQSLTGVLVRGLRILAAAGGGPLKITNKISEYSVLGNFQKLRYWGLVEQADDPGQGVWKITTRGLNFVNGIIRLPQKIWTWRAEFLEDVQGTKQVWISDVKGGTLTRDDYAAAARAH